jgi:hypothetical protein
MKKGKLKETCKKYGRHEMACKCLVGKHGGSRALGRRRRRQEDTIKIVLKEVVWKGVGLILWLRMHDCGRLT